MVCCKVLINVSLLLATLVCQAQVEGLGKFKIGRSTSAIMNEVAAELKTPIVPASTIQQLYGPPYTNRVNRMSVNTGSIDDEPSIGTYCSDITMYYLPKYTIAGHEIESIYLAFENDTLRSISIAKGYRFKDIFIEKYGAGVEHTDLYEVNCPDLDKDKPVKMARRTTQWQGPDVQAVLDDGTVYDSNCKRQWGPEFYIQQKSTSARLNACELTGKRRADAAKTARKKDKLKDF